MLGAGLLWFGWFGFNVGSALSLNDVALTAFINTNIAAAASALTWMLSEWFFQSKPTAMGAACGVVSGLVAITPACGFVTPFSALLIGAIGGIICFGAVFFLKQNSGMTIHLMPLDATASEELGAVLQQDYLQLLRKRGWRKRIILRKCRVTV